jgi:hypothetical protein
VATSLRGTHWRHRASGTEGQVVSTWTEMKPGWPAPRKTVTLCATIDPKREGTPFQVHARKELIPCCELQGSAFGYSGGPCPIHGGPTYVDMPYTSDDLVIPVEQLEEDWELIGRRPPAHGPMPRSELQVARHELRAALLRADPVTLAGLRHHLHRLEAVTHYAAGGREEADAIVAAINLALFPL